jgi:uncharacterized protein (TIGR02466 family)
MPPPEILPLFAVPFAFSHHPAPQQLNAALRSVVLAYEQRGNAGSNPRPLTYRNAPLYESHFNLFRDPDPAIQELKRHCWDQLLGVIAQLNGFDQLTVERLQIYNDAWFHVTRRGGYFGLHNHPNASWSGVYCVDPGRHDAGNPESGALTLVNPMLPSAMFMDAAVARIPPPFGPQIRSVKLQAGQLVIFPSYLLHEVKPFEGEGERITIAFNCWFTLPDAAA